jgi:ribosome recycling factor
LRILLGQKQAPVESDDSPASAASVEADCKDRMEKSLESVKRNFDTISTGRANPKMLDRVTVDYYGTPTPLNQMASVTTPESSLVVIQPYDISAIPDIERAILGSDVDITPSNDGKVIRLQVPQLTAERRKEMTKVAGKMGEEGKVAIRNVRRDMLKKVEKLADEVGEDGKKDLDDKVQKLTDSFISSVDALLKSKNEELLKV